MTRYTNSISKNELVCLYRVESPIYCKEWSITKKREDDSRHLPFFCFSVNIYTNLYTIVHLEH